MKMKFITFTPRYEIDKVYGRVVRSATLVLNEWLEENPNVEIISWQTCPVGKENELYITVQYKEN